VQTLERIEAETELEKEAGLDRKWSGQCALRSLLLADRPVDSHHFNQHKGVIGAYPEILSCGLLVPSIRGRGSMPCSEPEDNKSVTTFEIGVQSDICPLTMPYRIALLPGAGDEFSGRNVE
jgi:hypothetical protein